MEAHSSKLKTSEQTRQVRLCWRPGANRKIRAGALALAVKVYPDAKDDVRGVVFTAPKDSTKYVWLFLIGNRAWSKIE